MRPGRGGCVSLIFLLFVCTPPPLVQKESVPGQLEPLLAFEKASSGSAYGDAVICINGETYAGSAEVAWDSSGLFKAHFYGPLGVTVASVEEHNGRGRVLFDEGDYTFSRDQTMDTLPFSWGSDCTFGELELMLTGRVPAALCLQTRRPPDSLSAGRAAIKALWKTDTSMIRVKISHGAPRLESVEIIRTRQKAMWVFSLGKFKQGVAHKIELRENDRNYFFIKYAKMHIR